jgi:hypothetical protein
MVKLEAVTKPPRATVDPEFAKSVVVDTVAPFRVAARGDPMVAPVRVTVYVPAATAALAETMTAGKAPPTVVANPVGTFSAMVPLM